MNEPHLDINGNRMVYLQFGTGSELLIAIPGYGDRAVLFERLKDSLSQRYTVYVLQLPLHGASTWVGRSFGQKDFAVAIEQIRKKELGKQLSLMGYSFGARVVCTLLLKKQFEVKAIYLLAPDGFNAQYIRRATFLPSFIRHLLQATLSKPFWYLSIAKGLNSVGLLKSYSLQFVERHLATEKRRNRLFLFWNSIADFQYEERDVGLLLEENKIPTTLVLGKKDVVIPTARWKAWGEALEMVQVKMLDEGHRLVGKELNYFFET